MHRRTLYLLILLIPVLAGTSLISACGQKGPLYLPDPAEQAEQDATKKENQ